MALTDKLTAIGNAIRAKTGETSTYTLDEMATAIEGIIVEGPTIEDIAITNANCNSLYRGSNTNWIINKYGNLIKQDIATPNVPYITNAVYMFYENTAHKNTEFTRDLTIAVGYAYDKTYQFTPMLDMFNKCGWETIYFPHVVAFDNYTISKEWRFFTGTTKLAHLIFHNEDTSWPEGTVLYLNVDVGYNTGGDIDTNIANATYNHDSAVETLNSLPNNSNPVTISFYGPQGSATTGGAINTLTAEEVAIATAKNWTVALSS